MGTLIGKVYNKVNENTDIALGFLHGFTEVNDRITFGIKYKHSDAFVLKTKVENTKTY